MISEKQPWEGRIQTPETEKGIDTMIHDETETKDDAEKEVQTDLQDMWENPERDMEKTLTDLAEIERTTNGEKDQRETMIIEGEWEMTVERFYAPLISAAGNSYYLKNMYINWRTLLRTNVCTELWS